MKLISMTCPTCGGNVEADEYSQSFTCKFCGTTTVIEKDSFNYSDDSIREAELLIRNQQNYARARDKFIFLTERDANDPRPWLGLVKCDTKDFNCKCYIDVPGYEPIWLSGMEERIKYYFQNYYNLEKKAEHKAHAQQLEKKYFEESKKEYDALKEKYTTEKDKEDVYINNYEQTITANNKVIDSYKIKEIIIKINDIYNRCMAIAKAEQKWNEDLDYDIQEYSFEDKYNGSYLTYSISLTDDTSSSIDNFDEFIYIYENRLNEIKNMRIKLKLDYNIIKPIPHRSMISHSQSLDIYMSEKQLEITTELDSEDRKLDKVYNDLRQVVLNAPEKYDFIVKKRGYVSFIIGLGIGLIPGIIIATILTLVESVRNIYTQFYIVYPFVCITIGFLIAEVISFIHIKKLYKPIEPEREYAGYKDGHSVYKDNVEDYTKFSEITIGKNVNTLTIRNKIKKLYSKYKLLFLVELGIIAVISVAIVLLKNIVN